MPVAALDCAGGGSDDHRMQIVTRSSRRRRTLRRDPLRGRRRRRSSRDGCELAPARPAAPHARAPVHQHGCTAGSHGRVEWPEWLTTVSMGWAQPSPEHDTQSIQKKSKARIKKVRWDVGVPLTSRERKGRYKWSRKGGRKGRDDGFRQRNGRSEA
eukprot:3827814-Prymnesium_polylepis.1